MVLYGLIEIYGSCWWRKYDLTEKQGGDWLMKKSRSGIENERPEKPGARFIS